VTHVRAAAHVPGTVDEVRALWFDLSRWPSFVDGFGSVVRADPGWPATGEVVWDSTPHGRGRVIERRDGTFEDGRLTGRQTVRFEPSGDGVAVAVELDYRLKERTPLTPLLDRFFVRRAVRDALVRTVRRFAAEARLDADLRAGERL
jgi:hypothetical protein